VNIERRMKDAQEKFEGFILGWITAKNHLDIKFSKIH
jgi:hypothetical protein